MTNLRHLKEIAMGMKPLGNESAAVIRNAVNQQKRRTQAVRNAYTQTSGGTAPKEKPVKGSIQHKR
jgi:hypothetical protein